MEVSLWAPGTLPAGERRRPFAAARERGAGAWVIWLRWEGRESSPRGRPRACRAFGLISLGPLRGGRAPGLAERVALGFGWRPHAGRDRRGVRRDRRAWGEAPVA